MYFSLAISALVIGVVVGVFRARSKTAAPKDAPNVLAHFEPKSLNPGLEVVDPRIAATGIVLAFVEIEHGTIRTHHLLNLSQEAQTYFNVNDVDATKLVNIGAWINDQTPSSFIVIEQLQGRLRDLAGGAVLPDLQAMISAVAGPLSHEGSFEHSKLVRHLTT